MFTPLPNNFSPGTRYALDGELLNRLSNTVNAANAALTQSGHSGFRGAFNGDVVAPPFICGIISVTSVANTCANITDGETYAAPCARLGKYRGKLRWWRADQTWQPSTNYPGETTDELSIDTGAYHDGRGEQYGPAPALTVGDVLPGYFDPGRGILVAMPGLFDQVPAIDARTGGAAKEVRRFTDSSPAGFNMILEVYDPQTKKWTWPDESRIVCPSQPFGERKEVGGTHFVMVPMRHGSALRLRTWYKGPLAVGDGAPVRIESGGMRVMPIGRIHRNLASWNGIPDIATGDATDPYPLDKTTSIGSLMFEGNVLARPRDTPKFRIVEGRYATPPGDGESPPPTSGSFSGSDSFAGGGDYTGGSGYGGGPATNQTTGDSASAVQMLAQSSEDHWNCLVWFWGYWSGGNPPILRGKLDYELVKDGNAEMSIWEYNGTAEADTTYNQTVYDWLLATGQTIASGKKVVAQLVDGSGDRYYVTAAECP